MPRQQKRQKHRIGSLLHADDAESQKQGKAELEAALARYESVTDAETGMGVPLRTLMSWIAKVKAKAPDGRGKTRKGVTPAEAKKALRGRLTPEEAAKKLGVSRTTLLRRAGKLTDRHRT